MLENIKQAYTILKDWFWALPVWKRAILSSFIGALGGSTVVGFFNKYALYYHAYQQGIRIPVEGVEYIDLVVTMVSFFLMLVTITGSIVLNRTINNIHFYLNKVLSLSKEYFLFSQKTDYKIFFFLLPPLLFNSIVIYCVYNANLLDGSNYLFLILGFVILFLSIVLLLFVILEIFSLVKERLDSKENRILLTLLTVISITFCTILLLFHQPFYRSFLQNIQYGGEIPIKVEYRKADNTEANIEGLLLIRTNKSITLRDTSSRDVSEIPMERVSRILFVKDSIPAHLLKMD